MISRQESPSPLCTFMEQLGKSMGSIEIVDDNAPSHSPAPLQRRKTADARLLHDANNRWNAVYQSTNDSSIGLSYCRSSSDIGCCNNSHKTDASQQAMKAQRRWSACGDSTSSVLTLTQCSKIRRSSLRRRNSADDTTFTLDTTVPSSSKDDSIPTFGTRRHRHHHSPIRSEREQNCKRQML